MASEYNPSEIETITQYVNKLTASSVFAQAERLVSFIRYIVGETLKNDGKQINQYVLAMELYNRDESFDPATDSVVRVDAGRLRTKLREYYDTEGKNDDVRFELPKGNYVVKINLGSIVSSEVSSATVADEPPTLTPVPSEQSIAVLPFVNMSSDPEQVYFSDGIAEELLNQLTKLRGLHVAGRTSSFYFKNRHEDLRVIGEKLNVAHILEGSVRKAGSRVRITIQLIKVIDGYHLWSESYDRDLDDIFAIQEEIAKAVANALSITLGVGEFGAGGTRNLAAYDAYLAGLSLYNQFGRETISRAIEQLEKAVALDPDFAHAWSTLTFTYHNAATTFISERAEEFFKKSEAAASHALAIAPEAVASLHAEARLQIHRHNWTEAEHNGEKALELAPADHMTNRGYGFFLMNVGRVREAIDYFRVAVRTEPLALLPSLLLGIAHQINGDFDEALKEFERGKGLVGDQSTSNNLILILARDMGDRALLEASLEKIVNDDLLPPNNRSMTIYMRSHLDEPEAARMELHRLYRDPAYNNPDARQVIAVWSSYFGDHELALKAYYELCETKAFSVYVIWRSIHKTMRQLPAFKDVVRSLGLVDYWRSSGKWGDFCRPAGEDDFECE